MSSHHFVRPNQEPALIIANGEACAHTLLEQLLEWNPHVVALDGAYDRVIKLGIKVDTVIGDFDSISTDIPYNNLHQSHINFIQDLDQDTTDLEKALLFLISNNITHVNVVWATGHRTDHLLANITNLVKYQKKIAIKMIDDYSEIFLLPKNFQKWYCKGVKISLYPFPSAQDIVTQNLAFPLNHETLHIIDRIGTSNYVTQDGMVKISYTQGNLILITSK